MKRKIAWEDDIHKGCIILSYALEYKNEDERIRNQEIFEEMIINYLNQNMFIIKERGRK